jgi:hypothetical protein
MANWSKQTEVVGGEAGRTEEMEEEELTEALGGLDEMTDQK